MRRLLERILSPRSYCSGCGRAWFSDQRRPCPRCRSTERTFSRQLHDATSVEDKLS